LLSEIHKVLMTVNAESRCGFSNVSSKERISLAPQTDNAVLYYPNYG
jgi:hypothetical protein